jgi:hypothetical protein
MSCARPVGPGFSPLDEQLCLLSSHFSPFLIEGIVRLGAWMPFEQVPAVLQFFTGVHVTPDTVRRMAETAGAAQVTIEQRELERIERDLPAIPEGPDRQVVSADGAMVPLLHGAWAEARTLALGVLPAATDVSDEPVHAHDIRYFSRLCSAHDFTRQVTRPCYARGTARAGTVVAVGDGADWLQDVLDAHCPQAVRILDFPHAAGYVADVAKAAFGAGTQEVSAWLATWLHELKHGQVEAVLAAIRLLAMPGPEAEETRTKALAYLTARRGQMAYATWRQQGYPIGSGMVESANKLVVEARLKGSGMHWASGNVTPMLALRGVVCSGTWAAAWPGIWTELRRQTATRRTQRHLDRQATQHSAAASPSLPTPDATSSTIGPSTRRRSAAAKA